MTSGSGWCKVGIAGPRGDNPITAPLGRCGWPAPIKPMIKTAEDLRRYLAQAPASRPVRMAFLIGQGAVESIDYIAAGDLLDMLPEDEGLYIPDSSVTITDVDWPEARVKAWGGTDYIGDYLEDAAIRPLRNAKITGLTASGIDQEPELEPIKQLSDPLRDPKLSWMRSRG